MQLSQQQQENLDSIEKRIKDCEHIINDILNIAKKFDYNAYKKSMMFIYYVKLMELSKGSITVASEISKQPRTQLYQKLKEFDIDVTLFRVLDRQIVRFIIVDYSDISKVLPV